MLLCVLVTLFQGKNHFFYSQAVENHRKHPYAAAKTSKTAEKRPSNISLSGIESESGYMSGEMPRNSCPNPGNFGISPKVQLFQDRAPNYELLNSIWQRALLYPSTTFSFKKSLKYVEDLAEPLFSSF